MKKDSLKFSKKVLLSLFIFLFLFIITCFIGFFVTGDEPTTLITCVFAASIGEFSVLGYLKNCEYKYENQDNEEQEK